VADTRGTVPAIAALYEAIRSALPDQAISIVTYYNPFYVDKRSTKRIFTELPRHVIVSLNNNNYGGLLWQKQITEKIRAETAVLAGTQ
jgi:hypothetical protein